jgi:hypothetical protein
MHFAVLPPEVNSGRMYAGPGAGPMLAAATAWDELANELHPTAANLESVISELRRVSRSVRVAPRTPAPTTRLRRRVAGHAAELREITEVLGRLGQLRDSGVLTDQEFGEQKQRLLANQ